MTPRGSIDSPSSSYISSTRPTVPTRSSSQGDLNAPDTSSSSSSSYNYRRYSNLDLGSSSRSNYDLGSSSRSTRHSRVSTNTDQERHSSFSSSNLTSPLMARKQRSMSVDPTSPVFETTRRYRLSSQHSSFLPSLQSDQPSGRPPRPYSPGGRKLNISFSHTSIH